MIFMLGMLGLLPEMGEGVGGGVIFGDEAQ